MINSERIIPETINKIWIIKGNISKKYKIIGIVIKNGIDNIKTEIKSSQNGIIIISKIQINRIIMNNIFFIN